MTTPARIEIDRLSRELDQARRDRLAELESQVEHAEREHKKYAALSLQWHLAADAARRERMEICHALREPLRVDDVTQFEEVDV
jgi:hypothetical protein